MLFITKQSHHGVEGRILLIYKTKLALVEEAVKGMNFHFLQKSKAALFLSLSDGTSQELPTVWITVSSYPYFTLFCPPLFWVTLQTAKQDSWLILHITVKLPSGHLWQQMLMVFSPMRCQQQECQSSSNTAFAGCVKCYSFNFLSNVWTCSVHRNHFSLR